ncbi:MAG: hypothetical protein ACRC28_14870 [Clostridium sp.]|uniref:hypothetical protein n=1 Tax=Clostridium sp. TaxID=1506 RepID=UPI003F3A8256
MENKLILNISHINPKSLDVELSSPASDIVFKLYNENSSFKVALNLVYNSLNPSLKTLIIPEDEDISSDDDLLMSPYTNYILKAFKDDILVDEEVVSFTDFPAPLIPKVTSYGNRLIEIQFEYPIRHLDDSSILSSIPVTLPIGSIETGGLHTTYACSNFYVKYFKEDPNQSNTPDPKWPGYILPKVSFKYGTNEEITLAEPFTVSQSDDSRTLLIQSNIRSLPIGFHNLQVATSKIADHHLTGLHLADFYNRDVPISEVEFELTGAQYSATVKNVSIIDPQTVEVQFTSPVIDISGKITVDSIASVIRSNLNESVSLSRKPSTLDTLIFRMDGNTFITPGPNAITVSGIVDCYGLLISNYKYSSNLELPKPAIISILQDKSVEDLSLTRIDLTFSHSMRAGNINTLANYSVFADGSSTLIPVSSIIFNPSTPTKATLEFEPQLASGIYTLIANNLVDIYGSLLENIPYDFLIVDTTRPKVLAILGTEQETPNDLNDTILIKFGEAMASSGEHGINKGVNFKLAVDGTDFATLEDFTPTVLKNNFWTRFNLNTKVNLTLANSLIKVGYVGLTKVFYVTDASGNIVNLCEDYPITKLLPTLKLDGGVASITDSNKITYTLPTSLQSEEGFDIVVYKEDFIFKADASDPLTISSVVVSDDLKTLTFTFTDVVFSSGVDYLMSLNKVNRDILSEDILNRPIELTNPITVKNNLRPEIVSISTVWVDNVSEPNEAVVALKLSSPINVTHVNDFIVYNGEGLRLNVSRATIVNGLTGTPSTEGSILELYCKSPVNTNALANELKLSTTPEAYRITGFHSADSYVKLKSVVEYPSYELYPISSNVVLGPTLFTSKFQVEFTDAIDVLESKNPDGTISVAGILMSTEGPSSVDPSETEPFATLRFDNIFELRSNIRTYETSDSNVRDNAILNPTVADEPDASLRSISKGGNNYEITALLTIEDKTLTIEFSNIPPSSIPAYFKNEFVLFELLPLGYKLFGISHNTSLNESITVKFPFRFGNI